MSYYGTFKRPNYHAHKIYYWKKIITEGIPIFNIQHMENKFFETGAFVLRFVFHKCSYRVNRKGSGWNEPLPGSDWMLPLICNPKM
jgi:hypothetical protein